MLPVELLHIPLFASLRSATLVSVASQVAVCSHARGALLFRAGDACDDVTLLLDGVVRLSRREQRGAARTVALIRPGGLVSVVALRGEPEHVNEAVALTAVRVVNVPIAAVKEIGLRHADLLASLTGTLLERIADDCIDAASGAQPKLARRTFALLDRLAEFASDELSSKPTGMRRLAHPLSHADLARVLCADRASVTRALGRLEARGLIERERGHVASVAALSGDEWRSS